MILDWSFLYKRFSIKDVECGSAQTWEVSNNHLLKSSLQICNRLHPDGTSCARTGLVVSVSGSSGISSRAVVSLSLFYPQNRVFCFLMSFSDSKYNVWIKTNAYCTSFWGGSSGLKWTSTFLWVPQWPKVKDKLLTTTCEALGALDGFYFIVFLLHLAVTPGLQNHT